MAQIQEDIDRELGVEIITIGIEEKPAINFLVNRGMYVLQPEAIDYVPQNENFPITELFEKLIDAKKKVGVFNFDDAWIDVGAPEDLLRARGLS